MSNQPRLRQGGTEHLKKDKKNLKSEKIKSKNSDMVSVAAALGNIGFTVRFLFRKNKMLFFVRIPFLLLQTASSVISIFFLRIIINELTGDRRIKTVLLFAAGLAGANLAVALVKRVFSVYDRKQWEKTSYDINLTLGKAVAGLPYSDIEEPEMKDFIARASSGSFSTVIDCVTEFTGSVINVVTYTSIIIFAQPLILAFIAAVVIIQTALSRVNQKADYENRVIQAPFTRKYGYLINVLSDWRFGKELRTGNLQKYFLTKASSYYMDKLDKLSKSYSLKIGIIFFFENAAVLAQSFAIYLLLGVKVVFGGMTVGDFSMYLSGAEQLTSSLSGIVSGFSRLIECGTFAKEFRYCITLSERTIKNFGNKTVPDDKNISIEFRGVSFKYPHTDNYVLKNISFKLNPGEKLSLVGVNGSGKTTIVKLLCRFYEPTEGEILIGGINARLLSAHEYARLFSVVFQDFRLFSFSVRENISMNMKADEARLKMCIEKSGLDEKLSALKNRADTSVYKEFDENGVEFSGGEGQKLVIARALYKNAPVIILDEPTAALDPIAEYEVYKSFNSLSEGKTAIYISHRLSSTRFTDKIAVLSDGELCEFGSHAELMSIDGGIYHEMFSMQAQYFISK